MTERPEIEHIDWSLTTWEGSRRAQMERWAALSLDQILEWQEEMAELSARLSVESQSHSQAVRADNSLGQADPMERISVPVSKSNESATSEGP